MIFDLELIINRAYRKRFLIFNSNRLGQESDQDSSLITHTTESRYVNERDKGAAL